MLSSDSTESLLAAAANKLRLKKKDVERAKLFVWRTGAELPRHHDWPSGAVRDDSLIAISLGEPYAGPTPPPPLPLSGAAASLLPDSPAKLEPIAPPGVSGSDDCGNRFPSLVELWAEQAAERTAYYAANQTFWDEDGYAGSTDEEAMIGDATTSATDVEHSLKLIDELRAKHPSLLLRSALDCGAGVGRVTKHVLLKRCEHVCLLEIRRMGGRRGRPRASGGSRTWPPAGTSHGGLFQLCLCGSGAHKAVSSAELLPGASSRSGHKPCRGIHAGDRTIV